MPENRLSDPGLALEHKRNRSFPHAVDEGKDRGEFLFSADDLGNHLLHEIVIRASQKDKSGQALSELCSGGRLLRLAGRGPSRALKDGPEWRMGRRPAPYAEAG